MYSTAGANAPKAAEVAAAGSFGSELMVLPLPAVLSFINAFIRVAPRVEAPLATGVGGTVGADCCRMRTAKSLSHDANIAICNPTIHCAWAVRDWLMAGDPKLSFRNVAGKQILHIGWLGPVPRAPQSLILTLAPTCSHRPTARDARSESSGHSLVADV